MIELITSPAPAIAPVPPAPGTTPAKDDYLTFGQAAKIVPGEPAASSLWRWAVKGIASRNGDRVRLQHVRMGGKIFTTAAWLTEFGNALAQASVIPDMPKTRAARQSTPSRARRDHEAAMKILAAE